MKRISFVWSLFLILTLTLLAGCGGGGGSDSGPYATFPLDSGSINLIFVASPDLAYQAAGDVNPVTANLSNQGLQRSLLLAGYLKQQVLGGRNVTGIYTLQPMSHLQTASNYPDIAAVGYIQQFALLNQITLTGAGGPGSTPVPANSYPLNASYAAGGTVPGGVATPLIACQGCQGLDFNDTSGNNLALPTRIINAGVPGYHVFSAPWETISALMTSINRARGYGLNIPAGFMGPNYISVISIAPSGGAYFSVYNSNLNPPSTYPVLPATVPATSCTAQTPFTVTRTIGSNGNMMPPGINTNQTVYMVRHAEAHPVNGWDDGNFLAAGQWRALALPYFLQGRISPSAVYSIDPAQVYPGAIVTPGNFNFSYVRPSLTVEPYAIANSLPYYLVSGIELFDPSSPTATANFFFTGGTFSNRTILLAWEHEHFPPIVNALLASYQGNAGQPTAPSWPDTDYDTIWTVTLDGSGNVTVNNNLCEGINSALLPATAPQF